MDTQAPAPSSVSGDGLYNLAEPTPAAPDAAAPQPEAAPAPPTTPPAAEAQPANGKANGKAGGRLGFLKRKPKAAAAADASAAPAEGEAATAVKKKRRRRRNPRKAMGSWGVSVIVHVTILVVLGLVTFSSEVKTAIVNINSALVTGNKGADELVHVYADPTSNQRSEQAVGETQGEQAGDGGGGGGGGGGGSFGGAGTGPPSATPRVRGVGSGVGEKNSLPGVKVVANVSGLGLLPSAGALKTDFSGGGMISGDVTYETTDVGVALDQLAREILRHLGQHKLTVVWLFDESESMKDDQRAIKEKFDRITTELKINADSAAGGGKKAQGALNHAIVGFGSQLHYELKKPTFNVEEIGKAIDRLRVDDTGVENTMHAVADVVSSYSGLIGKDRRIVLVLVTDESGDDGSVVEEALQTCKSRGVPIYIIGRQSLFGYERAHLRYVDPVTKDVYWPTIRRGPETADVELLQWDGLHERWDEQPSGFAPYELARLAKETGGIYFLLPSEENMRVRQREKAYSISILKEYIPDYESRGSYVERRNKSEFRRTLYEIIQATRGFPFRRHFPIMPAEMVARVNEEGPIVTQRLKVLVDIQKRLEQLQKLRDREPEKRWQAHYDLMLAQIVAYQIKAYEYRACLLEMKNSPPKPKTMPTAELIVEWVIDHSPDRKAPKEETAKKYLEAETLLKAVIAKHPKTPWADLAQDELNRGLGCQRNEWHHNPRYNERAKLVPKY